MKRYVKFIKISVDFIHIHLILTYFFSTGSGAEEEAGSRGATEEGEG